MNPHRLNPQQQAVVDHTLQTPKRHMSVVAGPGTGKTEALTLRMQSLLETGCDPSKIGCISFTHASVNEMRQRLTQRTQSPASRWHLFTFHSYFLHLLKSQVHATSFQFISPEIWQHHFEHVIIPSFMRKKPPRPISRSDCFKLALELITSQQSWFSKPPEQDILKWLIQNISEYYKSTPCPYISVTDLECFFWLKLNEGIITFFPYDHLLIDEFQDTSKIQFNILMTLLKKSSLTVFVVGDAKQSIYAFRKANVENFEDIQLYIKKKNGTQIYLTQNYRSQKDILDYANRFQITHLQNRTDPPLITSTTQDESEAAPQIHFVDSNSMTTNLISQCHLAIKQKQDCAILFRTKADLKAVQEALSSEFFDHLQTSDDHRISYMKSPFSRGLAFGILNTLFPKQSMYLHAWQTSIWHPTDQAIPQSLNAQTVFSHLMKAATARPWRNKDRHAVHLLMKEVTEAAHIFLPHFPYQQENYILKLLDPLLSQSQSTDSMTQGPKKLITLSTLHAAKGLEFERVILVITRKSIPRTQTYPFILENGSEWGIRYRHASVDTEFITEGPYDGLQKSYKAKQLQEEFRLLYVGITRAKKSLTILAVEKDLPKILHPWLLSHNLA